MEHNLSFGRDERSRTSDRESPPAVLDRGKIDFGGKPTKMDAFTLLHGVKAEANKNASDLEKVVRAMLQQRTNRAMIDNAHLSHVLSCLRYKNRLAQLLKNLTNFVANYVREHPGETAIALLSILSISIVPIILPAIGFSAIGPVAQSLAAAWQSAIGIVAAGTPFSFLQSAAMGGPAASVFLVAGVAGLAGLAIKKAAGWVTRWWNSKNDEAEKNCSFEELVREIRGRRDCEHKGRGRRVEGPHRCEECGDRLPQFILECRHCRFQACRRCRLNSR